MGKSNTAAEDTTENKGWVSVEQACIYLEISRSHFYAHVADRVDARYLGTHLRISRRSLDAFMATLPRIPRTGLRPPKGRVRTLR